MVYPVVALAVDDPLNNPSVSSINRTNSSPTTADSVQFTVTFSEDVTGVNAADFALAATGTAAGNIANVTGSNDVYAVTVDTITGDGNVGLNLVDDDTIVDTNTNPLGGVGAANGNFTGQVYAVDNTSSTVTNVTSAATNGTFKIGDTINATVTFSESVNVTGTPQLTLETGSTDRTVNYTSGSGTDTLTFAYTVQAGDVSSDLDYVATNSLTLNSGTIKDSATNDAILTLPGVGGAGSLGNNKALVIDGVVPIVTDANISIAGATGNGGVYKVGDTVTTTWNNTAGGDNNSDINAVTVNFSQFGGGSAVVASNSSDTWTATYQIVAGTINNVGSKNVSVTITDTAGNVTTTADTTAATVDNQAPSVVLTSSAVSPTMTSPIPVTATFSDTVTGFVVGDVTVGGGSAGNFSATSGTVYTFDVTPSGDGSVTVDVAGSVAQDTAGNNNSAAVQLTRSYDNTAPTVAITSPVAGDKVNSSKVVTFTDNESTSPQCSIDNSIFVSCTTGVTTLSNITGFNALSDGNFTLYLKDTDAAGNIGTTSQVNVVKDSTAPTAAVTYSINHAVKSGDTQTVTATFSETIVGTPQVALSGVSTVAATNMSATGNPLVWTYDYSVGSGNGSESIVLSNVTDSAGNSITGTPTSGASFTIDNTPPTVTNVTSGLANGSYKDGQAVPITVTFSEVVNVTGTPQLQLETGTSDQLVNYSSGTGTNTLTFNYTVQAGDTSVDLDYLSANAITLNSGTIKDTALNDATLTLVNPGDAGSLGANKALVIDTSTPSAPLTPDLAAADDTGSSNSDNITKNTTGLTFSGTAEANSTVELFEGSNSLGTVTATGGNYSFDLSLSAGSYSITAKATDAAANTSSASSVLALVVDTAAPTLSSVSIASNNSNTAKAKVGDVVTVTFTANETVQTPTVTIMGSSITPNNTGNTWTAARTMLSGDSEGTVAFTLDFTDTAGTSGTQVTAVTDSSVVTFDKTVPTISSITTKDTSGDGRVETATIVFSESVLDSSFAASNFTIGGSAGTSITTGTGNDNTFDVIVSGGVTGTAEQDVTYTQGSGSDISGNLLANVITATIIEADGAVPVFLSARTNSTTSIDLTFSEDLQGNSATNSDFSVSGSTLTTPDASEVSAGVIRLTLSAAIGTGATPDVTYSGSVTDLNSNIAPNGVTRTPADGVVPVLSSVSLASDNSAISTLFGKVGSNVILTFTSSETIGTPTVTFRSGGQLVAGSPTVNSTGNNWTAFYVAQSGDTEGAVTFTVDFADSSANSGAQVTAVSDSSSVTFDKTNPTAAGTPSATTPTASTTQNWAWNAGSDALSGVYQYLWSVVNNATSVVDSSGTTTSSTLNLVTNLAQGVWNLVVQVKDMAGNLSSTSTGQVTVDTTNPSVSADNASSNWINSNPTITLSVSDSGGAGLTASKVRYNWDATANATTGTVFTNGTQISVPSDGTHTLNLYAEDAVANSNTFNGTYKLDTVAPDTSSITAPANNLVTNTNPTFTASATDALSGVASVKFQYKTSSATPYTDLNIDTSSPYAADWTGVTLVDGTTYNLRVITTDNAGNTTNSSVVNITYTTATVDSGETLMQPSTTVDSSAPQVVVGNNAPASTVTIPSTVNNATLDLSGIVSGNQATITNSITINATNSDGNVNQVQIPAGVTVTGPSGWSGVLNAPQIQANSSITVPTASGETGTITRAVVEVGFGDSAITFDKAVRLTLAGQAGKAIAYSRGGAVTEILTACSADDQTTMNNELAAGAECKITVGNDVIVWTKHFTKFLSFDRTFPASASPTIPVQGPPGAPVCNDVKPGGSPSFVSAVAGTNSVTLNWSGAPDPVTYYLITYGTSSGAQTYGNPNVGGKGATSYTVSGLSGGTTYYFRIRAGNGCMPGSYSGEISATPGGGFVSEVAPGFAAGVLGAAAQNVGVGEENQVEEVAPAEGEVQGTNKEGSQSDGVNFQPQTEEKNDGGVFGAVGRFFGSIFGFIFGIFSRK